MKGWFACWIGSDRFVVQIELGARAGRGKEDMQLGAGLEGCNHTHNHAGPRGWKKTFRFHHHRIHPNKQKAAERGGSGIQTHTQSQKSLRDRPAGGSVWNFIVFHINSHRSLNRLGHFILSTLQSMTLCDSACVRA